MGLDEFMKNDRFHEKLPGFPFFATTVVVEEGRTATEAKMFPGEHPETKT